ncbi:MAG TPA: ATP-binding protein [Solirubrobacteraceae bacterium]
MHKHAHANEAEVLLSEREGGFLVRVTDDGVGFIPDQVLSPPGHLGLAAMRERARLASGRLRIDSAPRGGTEVECWIPSLAADTNEL